MDLKNLSSLVWCTGHENKLITCLSHTHAENKGGEITIAGYEVALAELPTQLHGGKARVHLCDVLMHMTLCTCKCATVRGLDWDPTLVTPLSLWRIGRDGREETSSPT